MMIIIKGKLQDDKDESRLRELEEAAKNSTPHNSSLNLGRNIKMKKENS